VTSHVEQGPDAGREFAAADETTVDPATGTRVHRLTDFDATTTHLYFTNDGWYDGGRCLLVESDRGGAHNLYGVHLDSGRIRQLTDLPPLDAGYTHFARNAAVDRAGENAYFWYGERLLSLDLDTLALDVLYESPEGFTFRGAHNTVTADDQAVLTTVREPTDADSAAERWRAEPVTRVVAVRTDGSGARVVHEEATELSHSNASPTRPDLATYAQEGPWDETDQRIWGLDLETGETWSIRPEEPGEMLGHEFWLAGGETVGYHGRYADGQPFVGTVRYDDTDRLEHPIPRAVFDHDGPRGHFAAHDRDLVVSDGTPDDRFLFCWRRDGAKYAGPRRLARHGVTSFADGRTHVHPRFSPDGERVLFCSDRSGTAQVYLADVPAFESLPAVET